MPTDNVRALARGELSRKTRRAFHPGKLLLVLMICVSLSACSSKRFTFIWSDRYIEAARLHDQERYEEATTHYEQLLKHAPDASKRRLILYRMALMQEQRGERDAALESYAAIYDDEVADEYGARAMNRSISIYEERGERDRALTMRERVVEKYPESIAAEHALRALRRARSEAGESEAFATYLREVSMAYANTEIEDFALMMCGEVFEEDLGDDARAIEAFDDVIALAHQGKLADDAIWRIANIHIRNERWKEALRYLNRLVAEHHGESWFIGDYNSEFADEARLESGRIYMEELKDYDAAIEQFEKFVNEFPTSLLCDDAAWKVVLATEAKGDAAATEEAMRRFLKEYPESRYARKARARLGQDEQGGAQ